MACFAPWCTHTQCATTRSMIAEERKRFRNFVATLDQINVNELVNAELYNRVSLITSHTIKHLKRNYTPQDMRAVLLKVAPNKYFDGNSVKGECTAPHKENRGISRVDSRKYWTTPKCKIYFYN